MASIGSTAPVFVVPAEATTANGVRPAARSSVIACRSASTSIRSDGSVATIRRLPRGKPASIAAFATDACACSLTYSAPERKSSGNFALRAATIAEKFASDPPEVSTPREVSGYSNRSHSHRTTLFSICAPTGASPHRFTNLSIVVERKSASEEANSPPPGMYARNPGPALSVALAAIVSTSSSSGANSPPTSGGSSRCARAISSASSNADAGASARRRMKSIA